LLGVLITGGAGFIGSNLAAHLLTSQDTFVTIYDNLSRRGAQLNIEWLLKAHQKRVRIVKGEIWDLEMLTGAMKDVYLVFHTAAQVAVTTSIADPVTDFRVNATGTLNVLEAVRRCHTNPILVYTSTNKVYGNNVNAISVMEKASRYEFSDMKYREGIPEEFPTDANEHTPYGCSKYAGDLYVRDYEAVYGLKTITFRMSCIYGPRQYGTEDQGWVAHFIISSILGKPLTIYGDGKQVRDILYIDDLLRAFDMAIEYINKTRGQAYNIGGGAQNTISLLELLRHIEDLLGRPINYSFDDWRPGDQKVYYSNISRTKRDFLWEPKISKEKGIRKLFHWVLDNKEMLKTIG